MRQKRAHGFAQVSSFDFAMRVVMKIRVGSVKSSTATVAAAFSTTDFLHNHAAPEPLEFQGRLNQIFVSLRTIHSWGFGDQLTDPLIVAFL